MERIGVPLSHGTLMLMEGATQDDWQVDSPNHEDSSQRWCFIFGAAVSFVFFLSSELCYVPEFTHRSLSATLVAGDTAGCLVIGRFFRLLQSLCPSEPERGTTSD